MHQLSLWSLLLEKLIIGKSFGHIATELSFVQ